MRLTLIVDLEPHQFTKEGAPIPPGEIGALVEAMRWAERLVNLARISFDDDCFDPEVLSVEVQSR